MLHQTRRYKILKHRCTTSSTWEVPMHPISRVSVLYLVSLFFLSTIASHHNRHITKLTLKHSTDNYTYFFTVLCIFQRRFSVWIYKENLSIVVTGSCRRMRSVWKNISHVCPFIPLWRWLVVYITHVCALVHMTVFSHVFIATTFWLWRADVDDLRHSQR